MKRARVTNVIARRLIALWPTLATVKYPGLLCVAPVAQAFGK